LAAILASASTLREFAELGAREREDLLATIQEEAERLNRFVANLLHMSRLESGALTPDRGALDLAEVVFAVARRLDRGRDAGRIAVTTGDAVLAARADPVLLDHALVNVLENALAYSPAGSPVAVAVRREGAAVLVTVQDEGPGVPAADLPRIFEKFFQSGPRRAERPGTGLGLSIARGLVEAMGGAVQADNRAGRSGLVVTLILPASHDDAGPLSSRRAA
jgi:two-component system sensor histidine kinase KdpD